MYPDHIYLISSYALQNLWNLAHSWQIWRFLVLHQSVRTHNDRMDSKANSEECLKIDNHMSDVCTYLKAISRELELKDEHLVAVKMISGWSLPDFETSKRIHLVSSQSLKLRNIPVIWDSIWDEDRSVVCTWLFEVDVQGRQPSS